MRSLPIILGVGAAVALGTYVHNEERRDPAKTYTVGTVSVSAGFPCTVASVTDGDTLRCSETEADGRQIRVRLSGVAARERDGSCAPGHPCPTATAEAATAELTRIAMGQVLQCQDVGLTYGRRAAFCTRSDGIDVSRQMIASGTVLRWDRYWQGHRC